MKCLLFASWKPYTTHPLAGYIHQIIGRPRVVVRAHLDFTSRSSSEQSVIWKCRAATRKLKAASLVSMTHCLDMLVDHLSPRQLHAFSLLHSGILQRWARYLGPCETGLHIFADTSNAESLGSLHMHECLTQVLTRTVARFTKSCLISLRGSFKHIQTLRHKLQRLERLVFVRSLLYLHSSPKWAPCSGFCEFEALSLQADSTWFQTITSLIRKDAFSANISRPSFHKNWSLIGGEKLPCWYWHNRAMAMSVKSCVEVHWLHLVSGQGSSSASKTCPRLAWACTWERVTCVTASRLKMALRSEEKIAGCNRSGQRREANRFRSDRSFRCFELTKFESICLAGTPKNHVFLVIRLRLFFWVTTAMHSVQANVAMYVFFQHDPYAFFATKCWKTMASLCLLLRNQSVRFDHFFYPLRAFLINDPKKLSFTRFSHNDKKYGISGFQARERQSQPRLLGSIIFHRIPWVCAVMECIQWVAWRTSSVSLSWCLLAFGRSKSPDAMPWAKESTEFDSPFQGEHCFETSIYQEGQRTKEGAVAASNARWWKDRQALLESPQFKHGRGGNEWKRYELYAGACILYIFKPSLPSPPTSHKTGAKWPAFLGVQGWILSHFTLAR